jgi:hypothetical protein
MRLSLCALCLFNYQVGTESLDSCINSVYFPVRFFTSKCYYLEFALNPISTNHDVISDECSIMDRNTDFLKQLGVSVRIISKFSDLISGHPKIPNERCG